MNPAQQSLDEWILKLPKLELHHHLDGALRSESLWRLYCLVKDTGRWSAISFSCLDELRRAVRCDENTLSLADFLAKFNVIHGVLRAAHAHLPRNVYFEHLEHFGEEIVEDQVGVGGVFLETRFHPYGLIAADELSLDQATLEAEAVLHALMRGLQRGVQHAKHHIIVRVILCALWTRPSETMRLVEMAQRARAPPGADISTVSVVGIDLAGDESAAEIDVVHKQAFRAAQLVGLGRTVHVGMAHRSAREAVDELYATRIGHGYHIAADAVVEEYVKQRQVHVECCITPACLGMGNYHLVKQQAMIAFTKRGVSYSLNTDDPTIKAATLLDEYQLAAKILKQEGYDEGQVKRIFVAMQHKALAAAFISDQHKAIVSTWLQKEVTE